jgi:hypothetical protein
MIIFARQNDFGFFSTGNERSPFKLGPYSKAFGIQDIVDDIFDTWVNNDGDIDCLFLVGHGNAGVLWLGEGLGPVRSAKFAKLRPAFPAGSRGIQIHGCACASATEVTRWNGKGTAQDSGPGYDFLRSLAKHSGTKATAPVDSVWGFNAAYSYDVQTLTVFPGGSLYFDSND